MQIGSNVRACFFHLWHATSITGGLANLFIAAFLVIFAGDDVVYSTLFAFLNNGAISRSCEEQLMIHGDYISLRTAKQEECRLVYDMGLSTDHLRQDFLESFEEGYDSFALEYEAGYFDDSEPFIRAGLMICLGIERLPIGFISYSQITDYRGRERVYHFGVAELDIWLNGEVNCGRGYGTDAIATLTRYLRERANINSFMICPERNNLRAMRAYGKAGFKEVPEREKEEVLLRIFGKQGLSLLTPEDEYLSDRFCFMTLGYQ